MLTPLSDAYAQTSGPTLMFTVPIDDEDLAVLVLWLVFPPQPQLQLQDPVALAVCTGNAKVAPAANTAPMSIAAM